MKQDTESFGQSEYEARLKDLADFKAGLLTLGEVKARAEKRRKAVGLRRGAASELVGDAIRKHRRELSKEA